MSVSINILTLANLIVRLRTGVVRLQRGPESRVRCEPAPTQRLNGPGSLHPIAVPNKEPAVGVDGEGTVTIAQGIEDMSLRA